VKLEVAMPLRLAAIVLILGSCVAAADRFHCPVTEPPEPAFVPPKAMPRLSPDRFYLGSPGLFAAPWNGPWSRSRGVYGIKFAWFAADIDKAEYQAGKALLTITGRRLNAPAPPLGVHGPNVAAVPQYYFFTTTLFFPADGCWEITAKRKENVLKFVVLVGP
jgi:hypothetical protein